MFLIDCLCYSWQEIKAGGLLWIHSVSVSTMGAAAAASTQELFCCVLSGYTMRTPEGTFFPVKEKDFR